MKALVISEPGQTELVQRDVPKPGTGEVLLRVNQIGFCGTDLSTFRGVNPLVSYPRIPGHEIAATIEKLGSGVPEEWTIGREVLVVPYTSCGECSACRQQRFNSCRHNQTLGVQRDGAMAEYFTAPWEKLLASDKLTLEELALVEPLTVGFHAVDRARVTESDTVAVFGCGAIGLGVLAGAAFRGARVVAIDIDDQKLALGKKCGATDTINSMTENLHEQLQEITDGHGPHVIIEAVGLPATFKAAVEEVCFAGRVVYIGYAKAPVEYETKLFVMKELDIMGSRNALPADFAEVIKMLEKKEFPLDEVITTTVPLADSGKLLAQWNETPGDFTKIHVKF